jgi:hypothetical protein
MRFDAPPVLRRCASTPIRSLCRALSCSAIAPEKKSRILEPRHHSLYSVTCGIGAGSCQTTRPHLQETDRRL